MNVTTVKGKVVPKAKCRNIKGSFYEIGNPKKYDSGECYLINDKYYRYNSPHLIWNCELKQYQDNRIVDLTGYVKGWKNKQFGYFLYNPIESFAVLSSENQNYSFVASEEDAVKMKFKYEEEYDVYIENKFDRRSLKRLYTMYAEDHRKYSLLDPKQYNIADGRNIKVINQYIKEEKRVNPKLADIADLMGDISFGFEFETSSGFVPEKTCIKNGFAPLKDGSINGFEYTSIPFNNASGLQKTANFLKIASNSCKIDQFCSLHVHLGNVIPKKEWNTELFRLKSIAIYMLYYQLQTELFELIPGFKKNINFLRRKKEFKDHCANLPSLGLFDNEIYQNGELSHNEVNKEFSKLFKFWNCGRPMSERFNQETRRSNYSGERKWNIKSRYHALNMFNLFFSNSGTVEFRAHHATLNQTKTFAWLLVVNAIARYATLNYADIISRKAKLNLTDLVDCYKDNFGKNRNADYTFIAEFLKQYIRSRKNSFIDAMFKGDIYGKEFDKDANFSFSYRNKTLI